MFKKKMKKIEEKGIKIVFSGRKEPLREDVLAAMDNIVERTKNNQNGILNICLNYGGQEEVVDAARKLALDYKDGKVDLDSINKENFNSYLYQELPFIDLVIRTSGEQRVSNFMLYQMSYAEFYFTDCLFPDFNELEFDKALDAYNHRDRRFGKA